MTDEQINDCFAVLGRAFAERRELQPKITELKQNLRTVGQAATTLADNPVHAESLSIMETASDVREDAVELSRSLARLSELDKILSC